MIGSLNYRPFHNPNSLGHFYNFIRIKILEIFYHVTQQVMISCFTISADDIRSQRKKFKKKNKKKLSHSSGAVASIHNSFKAKFEEP